MLAGVVEPVTMPAGKDCPAIQLGHATGATYSRTDELDTGAAIVAGRALKSDAVVLRFAIGVVGQADRVRLCLDANAGYLLLITPPRPLTGMSGSQYVTARQTTNIQGAVIFNSGF